MYKYRTQYFYEIYKKIVVIFSCITICLSEVYVLMKIDNKWPFWKKTVIF